jgi:hypothetical protein
LPSALKARTSASTSPASDDQARSQQLYSTNRNIPADSARAPGQFGLDDEHVQMDQFCARRSSTIRFAADRDIPGCYSRFARAAGQAGGTGLRLP